MRKRRASLLAAILLCGLTTSLVAQALTLDQCLRLALRENPALAVAAAATREAQADYASARAPLGLNMSAIALANWLNENRLSPMGANLAPGVSLYTREGFAGLTLRQLLYDGGRSSRASNAASNGVAAKEAGFISVRDETIMRVTQAFYRALLAAELVRVARDAVNRDQAFETAAQELFQAGKVTALDQLKAASARVEAEGSLTVANEAASLAVVHLAQAMGVDARLLGAPSGTLRR